MDAPRFDRISKAFAARRRDKRAPGHRAPAQAALVATPEATPTATTDADRLSTGMLFVQTYRAGSIAPVAGTEGRYTVTLDGGTGQTVLFADRPDRRVGVAPTPEFLEGLGFFPDNPPNAALVVETAPGKTDIAVVELFAPRYDPLAREITYEVEVLANWETSLEAGLTEAPTDLATLAPTFGAAHLFIDDCADAAMTCVHQYTKKEIGVIANGEHDGFCYSWSAWMCLPCDPRITDSTLALQYWTDWCNLYHPGCYGLCTVKGFW